MFLFASASHVVSRFRRLCLGVVVKMVVSEWSLGNARKAKHRARALRLGDAQGPHLAESQRRREQRGVALEIDGGEHRLPHVGTGGRHSRVRA